MKQFLVRALFKVEANSSHEALMVVEAAMNDAENLVREMQGYMHLHPQHAGRDRVQAIANVFHNYTIVTTGVRELVGWHSVPV